MSKDNPLSPHVQIYDWHISSLISISQRITGVINFILISILCLLVISLSFDFNFYYLFKNFCNTFLGKFILIGFCWSFSFHLLSEIRHLIWDAGYGFELKTSRITGLIVILGSFILAIFFYLIGKNLIL